MRQHTVLGRDLPRLDDGVRHFQQPGDRPIEIVDGIDAYDRILTAFEDGEAIRNPSKARGMRDEFLNDIRSAYKDP